MKLLTQLFKKQLEKKEKRDYIDSMKTSGISMEYIKKLEEMKLSDIKNEFSKLCSLMHD